MSTGSDGGSKGVSGVVGVSGSGGEDVAAGKDKDSSSKSSFTIGESSRFVRNRRKVVCKTKCITFS